MRNFSKNSASWVQQQANYRTHTTIACSGHNSLTMCRISIYSIQLLSTIHVTCTRQTVTLRSSLGTGSVCAFWAWVLVIVFGAKFAVMTNWAREVFISIGILRTEVSFRTSETGSLSSQAVVCAGWTRQRIWCSLFTVVADWTWSTNLGVFSWKKKWVLTLRDVLKIVLYMY